MYKRQLILNAERKDDEHDNRQDIAYIEADIILDLESAAFVGLLLEEMCIRDRSCRALRI